MILQALQDIENYDFFRHKKTLLIKNEIVTYSFVSKYSEYYSSFISYNAEHFYY